MYTTESSSIHTFLMEEFALIVLNYYANNTDRLIGWVGQRMWEWTRKDSVTEPPTQEGVDMIVFVPVYSENKVLHAIENQKCEVQYVADHPSFVKFGDVLSSHFLIKKDTGDSSPCIFNVTPESELKVLGVYLSRFCRVVIVDMRRVTTFIHTTLLHKVVDDSPTQIIILLGISGIVAKMGVIEVLKEALVIKKKLGVILLCDDEVKETIPFSLGDEKISKAYNDKGWTCRASNTLEFSWEDMQCVGCGRFSFGCACVTVVCKGCGATKCVCDDCDRCKMKQHECLCANCFKCGYIGLCECACTNTTVHGFGGELWRTCSCKVVGFCKVCQDRIERCQCGEKDEPVDMVFPNGNLFGVLPIF